MLLVIMVSIIVMAIIIIVIIVIVIMDVVDVVVGVVPVPACFDGASLTPWLLGADAPSLAPGCVWGGGGVVVIIIGRRIIMVIKSFMGSIEKGREEREGKYGGRILVRGYVIEILSLYCVMSYHVRVY